MLTAFGEKLLGLLFSTFSLFDVLCTFIDTLVEQYDLLDKLELFAVVSFLEEDVIVKLLSSVS